MIRPLSKKEKIEKSAQWIFTWILTHPNDRIDITSEDEESARDIIKRVKELIEENWPR